MSHEQHADQPRRTRLVAAVLAAIAFRYACFAVMTRLALWNEARPAPHLPDLLLAYIPYVPAVDRWNYVLWLLAWLPWALVLLGLWPRRFVRYMVAGGIVSLVRGVTIVLTGLGPVHGADVNAGLSAAEQWRAWFEILDPFGVFLRDAAHVYLTKDLFFSGHTASTFLLWLYVRPFRRLRSIVLLMHVLVVASVFLSHLHYSIDVIGAYAVAFSVFVLVERQGGRCPLGPRR